MLPSVYGCSSQQTSAPTPSATISSVTFTTVSYGTTLGASPTSIPLGQQITATANTGNSFTIQPDTLAQYYENSDASKQVFHAMQVGYTATNFSITDLPTDGNCVVSWQTSMDNTPANSGLSTWPTQGNVQGQFVPSSSKETGMFWQVGLNGSGVLNRADVFETSPLVGDTPNALYEMQPTAYISSAGQQGASGEPNNTTELQMLPFAAQNLGTSSSFSIVLNITLADGSIVSTPAQTITIPAGAVKTNLVLGSTINSVTFTTATSGLTIPQLTPIPGGSVCVATLNAGNSFTTPAITGLNQGLAQYIGAPDPSLTVLHDYTVDLDTSNLDLTDFPTENPIVRYVFTWDGSIPDPAEGVLYEPELEQPLPVTGTPPSVSQTADYELEVPTNTLIPLPSVVLPALPSTSSSEMSGGLRAYAGLADYTVNLTVQIQKSDGSYASSATQPLVFTSSGITEIIP